MTYIVTTSTAYTDTRPRAPIPLYMTSADGESWSQDRADAMEFAAEADADAAIAAIPWNMPRHSVAARTVAA